jgi:hypothetical protein
MRLLLALLLATVGTMHAWQEPRPVPLTSPIRVVKRGDARLRGITAVDVYVADLGGVSAKCGLSKAPLHNAARQAVAPTGLNATVSEAGSSWFFTVRVTIESVAYRDRCTTSIRTHLITHVEGIPEQDRYTSGGEWGSLLVGEMVLVGQTTLTESALRDHADRVSGVVAEHVATIAGRIRAANQ